MVQMRMNGVLYMSNSIQSYFKESYEELRKVAWPTRRQTMMHTIAVVGISLAVALFLGALDYGLSTGIAQLIVK